MIMLDNQRNLMRRRGGAEDQLGELRVSAPLRDPSVGFDRTCLECGATFSADRRHGDFCRTACRRAWNNRRAVRGAELYDLFMAMRFDREEAKDLKVWRLLNRMASLFREEDQAARAGRRSWRRARTVIARRPYLKADVLVGRSR